MIIRGIKFVLSEIFSITLAVKLAVKMDASVNVIFLSCHCRGVIGIVEAYSMGLIVFNC